MSTQKQPQIVPATGAQIDETKVERTVRISSPEALSKGFREAYELLVQGISTKVVLPKGTYRSAVLNLDWSKGKAKETLLIIEGEGQVVWSGADIFPLSRWKDEGQLLTHPWPFAFGNFAYSWSAAGLIGHRREMVFVNGTPLRPRTLEKYKVEGMIQNPDFPGQISYAYTGLRDPGATLREGEFGVTERAENNPCVFLHLPKGLKLKEDSIEVSVRATLLDLRGKNNVAIRGITFFGAANSDEGFGSHNAIHFSIEPGKTSRNVLIDRCKVLWSAQSGLHVDGENWTIRDSEFSSNGGSGIASGLSRNILFERNTTNFNVWRLWMAGEFGYYTGGIKMHETKGHTVNGHLALGNCTMGVWWDIHCTDVTIRDVVAIGNAANLQFELCNGPFVADRILLAGGTAGDGQARIWEHGHSVLRHSILVGHTPGSMLYNLRWFGRTDPHAAMNKITAGVNWSESNVFYAGPGVAAFGLIDDIRGPEWFAREPMSYRGKDNIFYHPTLPQFWDTWQIDEGRTPELAARAILVKDWKVPTTYREENPRSLNPGFRDLGNHDYRFSESSPLWPDRARYPQFALSKEQLSAWKAFCAWSGYSPDTYGKPEPDL